MFEHVEMQGSSWWNYQEHIPKLLCESRDEKTKLPTVMTYFLLSSFWMTQQRHFHQMSWESSHLKNE